MKNDTKLIKLILDNLQNLNEGKKKLSKKQMKIAKAAPPPDKITAADFRSLNKEKNESLEDVLENYINLDEKRKRKKKKQTKYPKQYGAPEGSKRNDDLDRCTQLYKDGKVKQAAKCRQKMEKPHMKENFILEEALNNKIEEAKLDKYLNEIENKIEEKRKRKKKKKSGKSAKGLSAKVKKSLDKKADKRGLTRGSVYAEFRKGLSAFLSSGSRKGMSAHQWAHARVNSANPSKSWAVVKKRKGGKKKKKK